MSNDETKYQYALRNVATYKYLSINSALRDNVNTTLSNNFECSLSQTIHNVRSLTLEYCEFANNFIPTETLTLGVYELAIPPGPNPAPTFTVTFPPKQFFTIADLLTYIIQQMNLLSVNGITYSSSLSPSNYITITGTQPFAFQDTDGGTLYLLGLGTIDYISVLATVQTAIQPFYNRLSAIGVQIDPLPSHEVQNSDWTRNIAFVVPCTTNYGEINYFFRNAQMDQSIIFFDKGNNFRNFRVKIVPYFINNQNDSKFILDLHSDIIMRFSYTSYNDGVYYEKI